MPNQSQIDVKGLGSKVLDLRGQGMNHGEIAELVGVDRSTVTRWLQRQAARAPRAEALGASVTPFPKWRLDFGLRPGTRPASGIPTIPAPPASMVELMDVIRDLKAILEDPSVVGTIRVKAGTAAAEACAIAATLEKDA